MRNFYLMCFLFPLVVIAQKKELFIAPQQKAFYSGGDFSVDIQGTPNSDVSYRLVFLQRTLAKGHFQIPQTGILSLKLNFPKLHNYVVGAATLTCTSSQSEETKNLYFFPRKLFHEAKTSISYWGKQEDKIIKDLESSGAKIITIQDITEAKTKVTIVYKMNLDQYPNITQAINQACQAGRKVIFIDPQGTIVWPPKLASISLGNKSYINTLDSRIDVPVYSKVISPDVIEGQPALQFSPGKTDLYFAQMKIEHGQVLFLSGDPIKDISTNPTFFRIIKSLITNKELTHEQTN